MTMMIMTMMIMIMMLIMLIMITSSCTGSNIGIMGGGVKNFSTCSLSAMHATLQPLVRSDIDIDLNLILI